MQVSINHPHAAVIAAFYNGKRVRVVNQSGRHGAWAQHPDHFFGFYPNIKYEIEPDVVVKYSPMMKYGANSIPTTGQFLSVKEAELHMRDFNNTNFIDKYMKYEYTDGVLTNVSVVSA